jgi:hypothetical protein
MRYGTVIYEIRDALGVSNSEYLLLDAIFKLQGSNEQFKGWCNASAAYLAYVAGIARRNIFHVYTRLEQMQLLEFAQHPNGRDTLKRATAKFTQMAILGESEIVTKRHHNGDETSLYANSDETSLVTKRHYNGDETSPSDSDETSPNNTVNNTILHTRVHNAQKPQPSTAKKEKKAPPISPRPPVRAHRQPENRPVGESVPVPFAGSDIEKAGPEKFRTILLESGVSDQVDTWYYFDRLKYWSATKGGKSADWLATAKFFISDDQKKSKLHTIQIQNQYAATDNVSGTPRIVNGVDVEEALRGAQRILARRMGRRAGQ